MRKSERGEADILESYEAGEWRPVRRQAAAMRRYRGAAAATFKRDRRVNIRISARDLDALRKRALREGLPYQTLIASLLHKYVSGKVRELAS